MVEINIPLEPVSASRPRVTRWATFYAPKYAEYKKDLRSHIEDNYKSELLTEGLMAFVTFVMPIPKSVSKRKREQMYGTPHIKKPDVDNLTKALFDGLEGIVFKNDSQIWQAITNKRYVKEHEFPMTQITLLGDSENAMFADN